MTLILNQDKKKSDLYKVTPKWSEGAAAESLKCKVVETKEEFYLVGVFGSEDRCIEFDSNNKPVEVKVADKGVVAIRITRVNNQWRKQGEIDKKLCTELETLSGKFVNVRFNISEAHATLWDDLKKFGRLAEYWKYEEISEASIYPDLKGKIDDAAKHLEANAFGGKGGMRSYAPNPEHFKTRAQFIIDESPLIVSAVGHLVAGIISNDEIFISVKKDDANSLPKLTMSDIVKLTGHVLSVVTK